MVAWIQTIKLQIGAVAAEEQIYKQVYDDISGEAVDAEQVKRARDEERKEARKREV